MLDLVNGEQFYPFFSLGVVGGDLLVKLFRDAVECDAVISFNDELLFQLERLLEVFDLGQEADDLVGDLTDDLNL